MAGQLVGPGFDAIRAKYAGGDNATYLEAKIVNGGSGVWGSIPMPAMPGIDADTLQKIVAWLTATQNQAGEES